MNRLGQRIAAEYSHYTVEDFVHDEFFESWVLDPDKATTLFWEEWLKMHPEKRSCVEDAINIVEVLSDHCYQLSDIEIKALWHRIKNYKR